MEFCMTPSLYVKYFLPKVEVKPSMGCAFVVQNLSGLHSPQILESVVFC